MRVTSHIYEEVRRYQKSGWPSREIKKVYPLSYSTLYKIENSKSFETYKADGKKRWNEVVSARPVYMMPYPQKEDEERVMGNTVISEEVKTKLLFLLIGACGGAVLLLVAQSL